MNQTTAPAPAPPEITVENPTVRWRGTDYPIKIQVNEPPTRKDLYWHRAALRHLYLPDKTSVQVTAFTLRYRRHQGVVYVIVHTPPGTTPQTMRKLLAHLKTLALIRYGERV